jgi:Ran GTPase-activating protein (RanGAP) involved in mRNA processing and transport
MSSSPDHHNSSSAKRRKGNDGTVVGFLSSWLGYFTGRRDDSAQHIMYARNEQMLERMEKLMKKKEEKLESLEEKLESLDERAANNKKGYDDEEEGEEEECSSSEGERDSDEDASMDESISAEELEKKGRSLHAYQEMVATNRNSWQYSASDITFRDISSDLTLHEADDVVQLFASIKNCTIKMRRGEYDHEWVSDYDDDDCLDFQGVPLGLQNHDGFEPIPHMRALRPHWEEFAQALDDFDLILDVMPDDTESCFRISNVELPVTIFMMIVKSLNGKPFRHYKFINNNFGSYGIRALIDLLDSNEELESLQLRNNTIDEEDENDFWSTIAGHPNLTKINIDGCCEGGRLMMLCGLIQYNELVGISKRNNLVDISMRNNGLSIPSIERQYFCEILASNTSLERLDLSGNRFNDEDAAAIATALETNNTLKYLSLENNRITEIGEQHFGTALRANNTLEHLVLGDRHSDVSKATLSALFDKSSLNSAADSNHTCYIAGFLVNRNEHDDAEGNRQRKIYNVLARRNKEMCNVQHFDEIDINLLPEILLAVQRYSNAPVPEMHFLYNINREVNALSIVYELMRKWDKAFTVMGSADS